MRTQSTLWGIRRLRRELLSGLATLLALAAGVVASAGEIEVTLTDRDGRAISNQRMSLRLAETEGWRRYTGYRATTNAAGKATFAEVAPGSYKVDVGSLEGRDFVDPEENPFAPTPAVTLVEETDRAEIKLELWRGVRVVTDIAVDRGEEPSVTVHHHNIETGVEYSEGIWSLGFVEKILVPGQWRLHLDPPPGYLLVGLEVNGRPEEGHEPVLTLEEYMPAVHVTWHYAAPATLTGKVTVAGAEDGPLVIRSELLEPGPWIEAALKRGGSKFEAVEKGLREDYTYEMVLPSGRWMVRPVGARLEESDPPLVELRLEPGDYRRVDFTVRHQPADGGTLWVEVEDAEGNRINDAPVEVWSLSPQGEPETRLGQGISERPVGMVRFHGMPAGDLLVVGGHAEFIETRLAVREYDPEEESTRMVTLRLEPGSAIWTRAVDEKDEPMHDVVLEVHRLDELPEFLLNDPAFAESKIDRNSRTDVTGYADISGLYPGLHRVTGRLLGAQAVTRFVRVGRAGSEVGDDVEVALGPAQRFETRMLVLPAASVAGSIACTDGGQFPPGASIRIFEAGAPGGDPREDAELREGSSVALDEMPLTGRRLDAFLAGPIEDGSYQVALRPTGFGRWSWAMDGEQRERAALLHVTKGEPSEIGLVSLDCEPAAEFRFFIADESPLPDLRDAGVAASVTPLQGNPEGEALEPRIELRRDSILLRELPEGKIAIRLRVNHPYFLPVADVEVELETELHRGWLDDEPVVVDGLGGAIRIRGDGGSARLVAEGVARRRQPLERGRTLFGSLPPGSYRVELCDSTACGGSRGEWDSVIVEPGRTTYLP